MITEQIRLNLGDFKSKVADLKYDDSKTPVKWGCEDQVLQPVLKKYFETPIEYHIPESQQIDDYRTEKEKPINNKNAFNAALNTMKSNIDIERVF